MDTRNKKPIFGVLLELLEQPEKCDVKFNVHLKGDAWMPFWGNKLILSIWSPVFVAHFSKEGNKECFSEIDIDSCPPTVFKHFLRFMYGSSEGISENKNNGKFLLDLYKIAESYQVEQLKKDCRKLLIAATVQFENVFQFLNAANYINLEIVKLRCFELIREKTAEVIAAQDLKKITSFMVFTVLELDTLSLSSEYDLLSWVFDWAECECNNMPEIKPQEIIKPFLPYLNFVSLEAEQFAALVNKHKKFFYDNDSVKIFLNICDPGPGCMPLPSWHNKAKNFRSYKTLIESHSSSDKTKNTTPVEFRRNSDTIADKAIKNVEDQENNVTTEVENQVGNDQEDKALTETENHSVVDSNSKSDVLVNSAVGESLKNLEPEEYHTENVTNSLNSFEQVTVSLSENALSVQDTTYHSLNEYHTNNSQIDLDYSRLRRKIKKKKVKKWYLLPDGKFEPQAKSIDSLDGAYSSGQFQSLISMVWRQHRIGTA